MNEKGVPNGVVKIQAFLKALFIPTSEERRERVLSFMASE